MATTDDLFLVEGVQRWGRAQSVLSAFEHRLQDELTRIGKAAAPDLHLAVRGTTRRIFGRGGSDPGIRVEFTGTFRKRPAELVVGIQWKGENLPPHVYAGFYEPSELGSLNGTLTADTERQGLRIEREEKRDWAVVQASALGLQEAFALVIGTLQRRVDGVLAQ